MKKQFLTAVLLSTCMTTCTEFYASDNEAEQADQPTAATRPQTRAKRLAAIRTRAEQRQTEVEAITTNIRAHAAGVEQARADIDQHTTRLENNLNTIDAKMEPLNNLSSRGADALERYKDALYRIKENTERFSTKAEEIASRLDQIIERKTEALNEAIRAGDTDIAKKKEELKELISVHTTITGQVTSLTDAVDTINRLLNPTAR
jgi:chromosome segregation ATPase